MKDCHVCSRTAASVDVELKSCSLCRGVRYCSLDCQKVDWVSHKLTCNGWGKGTAKKKNKPLNTAQKQLQDLTVAATRCGRARDWVGEGRVYCDLGQLYDSLGQHDKAVELYQKWLNIALEVGDRGGEGNAYGNLATVYNYLGQHDKAVEFYRKCLNIALEVGDRTEEGNVTAVWAMCTAL